MEEYQKRVVVELDELNRKIVKLTTYLFGEDPAMPTMDDLREKSIMYNQLEKMQEYSQILQVRIANFK